MISNEELNELLLYEYTCQSNPYNISYFFLLRIHNFIILNLV